MFEEKIKDLVLSSLVVDSYCLGIIGFMMKNN